MKKFKNNRLQLAAAAGLFVAALLGGCAGGGALPHNSANSLRAAQSAPTDADFPDPSTAFWRQGASVSPEALRAMNLGLGKDQVRQLIGWPHFNEGMFGSKEWNYLFQLRTGKGSEYVTCQYMVRFDNDANNTLVTTGMYFKGPDCLARIAPPVTVQTIVQPAPAPAPAPIAASVPVVVSAPAPQKISLGADGLFAFGKSSLNDMSPEGRAKIDSMVKSIRQNVRSLNYIIITGHTDHLGSDSDNLKLSLARADAVRDLLVSQGIDARKIRTLGMGDRQPVKTCTGSGASSSLVSCLQPNRRVEIEIQGEN